MGIDAQTYSNGFPKKAFGTAKGKAALKLVDKKAKEWAEAYGLGLFYQSINSDENGLIINVLPIVDSIYVDTTDKGVSVGFRSSNGGPGYHAAVVDMIDYLAESLKLEWNWGVAGDDCLDETSYGVERDFRKLQTKMSEFFKFLMGVINEQNLPGGAVCLVHGLGQNSDGLSGPQGIVDSEFPKTVMNANDTQLELYSKSFFLWYGQGLGGEFWKNLLRGLLWQKAQFRPPLNEGEEKTTEQIHYIVNELMRTETEIPIDLQTAVNELKQAIIAGDYVDNSKIGYLKDYVQHFPFQYWQVALPGKMIVHDTGEDTAVTFFDGEIVLRFASITATTENPDTPFDWSRIADLIDDDQEYSSNDLIWRKSKPKADGAQISQNALIVHDGDGQHDLLLLTLTVNSTEDLSVYEDWINLIGYREENTG
jgi:hypothetical protein